jgi:hypothetical protein
MSLTIRVEISPGTEISRGSYEIINLANKLGHTVIGDFNGVTLMGQPGDDPLSLENKYYWLINNKIETKVACSD